MKQISQNLLFFGSGPVAAHSLGLLLGSFNFELVITKNNYSEKSFEESVENIAKKAGIPVGYANNQQELDLLFKTYNPQASCGLVIDYGVMISSFITLKFNKGLINSHFSLLPEWRGADPITYALLSGQNYTGVSLILINSSLDEGEILAQKRVVINKDETNPNLTKKLIECSNELIKVCLPNHLANSVKLSPQSDRSVTYSKKLIKSDGRIDWRKTASELEREIRAFAGWPKSYCILNGVEVIIFDGELADGPFLSPGEIFVNDSKEILVGCRVGNLKISQLQPQAKNIMNSKDFINGYLNKKGP